MTGKIIEMLKAGTLTLPRLLLTNYKQLKITDQELIILIYLINDNEFDPEKIAEDLQLKVKDVLTLINELNNKDILSLKNITNNNICEEYVCLDELYNKLALLLSADKKEVADTNIFDLFEKEFGRTLSSMEYEIIGAWLEANFTEELITLALKEAIYNGVTNLRYIDKILYEWQKKGIKTKEDVTKQREKFTKKEKKEVIFDYDWLNE